VDRNGVTAQMFSQAHSSFAQDARAAIGSARIGELKAIHVECIFAIGPPGTAKSLAPRIERARPDRFTFVDAKREMFDIGVYAVALVRWLTGRKISTVDAVTSNFFFQEHEQAGVDDFGIMIMDLEGGVSATIAAGRFGWTSHPARGATLDCACRRKWHIHLRRAQSKVRTSHRRGAFRHARASLA